jgi:cell division septum initiation protein DivIVA
MMTLTTGQLDNLTREELLELLKQLLPLVAEVERLRQRVEELEAEIERLKNRSANSGNSSQPPSRDQKVNQPPKKNRKKHGPPFGHPKYSRPLVEKPDQVITAGVEQCQHCQAGSRVCPTRLTRSCHNPRSFSDLRELSAFAQQFSI